MVHLINPQAIILVFGPGGCGLNGLFGPFRPSTAHGTIRPLLAQIQGGSSSAPKARWAHVSQFWPQNPPNPENAQNTLGQKNWPQFSPWPLATTRGQQLRGRLFLP
ncbi:hypothetical protein O181_023790 [Austropuccinia psidii MF-1]|uniref:Uncharacterized protein n=1 Tax=Austropuccinia psidii MF-1 TaxID=1389203 RepID=A0A9Q3GZF4_9BASI|nr:hypothetical protein [Austropuccinia psidii MF-1]